MTSADYFPSSLTSALTGWIPGLTKKENTAKSFIKDLNFPEVDFTADLIINFPPDEFDEESRVYFKSIPKLLDSESHPPSSANALRYRVQTDIKLLKKALKNRGYLEGEVTYDWNQTTSTTKPDDGEEIEKKRHIQITMETGPRYTFSEINIELYTSSDNSSDIVLDKEHLLEKARKHAAIAVGNPVDLDSVADSLLRLKKYFQGAGYPLVEISPPFGKIDDKKKTLSIDYKIILKGKKNFGDIQIIGLKNLSESYVRNRLIFQTGETYDNQKIERSQQNLLNSELFSSLTLTPSPSFQDQSVPLTLQLLEAPPRSVGAGIRYATQEGVGGKLFWQHRNFWGSGEKFLAKIEGSQRQVDATISFEKPDFYWQDLTLVTKIEGTKANTKAYKGEIYSIYEGIRHQWDEKLVYSWGGLYEYSRLKQNNYTTRSFTSWPLDILYDASNDPINPFRGWKIKVHAAPFFGDIGKNNFMAKTSLFGSYYARLIKKDRLVIALWGQVGKILASPLSNVPLDKRFYSGGVNSVRGYGFQRLGPISVQGKPTGGQSQIELGIEPRVRVGENIGLCIFVEAGKISATGLPKGNLNKDPKLEKQNKFLVGYGLGAKYYTDVGPIRLDVAFPTKRRTVNHKKYDSPFQVYLSIGQSF